VFVKRFMSLRIITGLGLLAALLVPAFTPAYAHPAQPTCDTQRGPVTLRAFSPGDQRVEFCHGTGSESNSYVILDLPISGACGHFREHYLVRPPRTQFQDIFPGGFVDLALSTSICET